MLVPASKSTQQGRSDQNPQWPLLKTLLKIYLKRNQFKTRFHMLNKLLDIRWSNIYYQYISCLQYSSLNFPRKKLLTEIPKDDSYIFRV